MSLEIEGVSRRFSEAQALRQVSLSVRRGEFVALLGPSGSGKTTLLRLLAGLDFPDEGRLLLDGRDLAPVPARARGIGFVFQSYALFRHMTVFENVAFGLRVRPRGHRPGEKAISERVNGLLERMQIGDLGRRYPDQISGGQRQRVALARALAIEPRLLLLDEPFGALDAEVRQSLRRWLRTLHDEMGLTSLFVTHDQEEAMAMADRVAIMREGRIVQADTPMALLERPADAFVARFLGLGREFPAVLGAEGLRLEGFEGVVPAERVALADGARPGPVLAFLGPQDWAVEPGGEGVLRHIRRDGQRDLLEIEAGGRLIEAEAPAGRFSPGAELRLIPLAARVFCV
ncbi:ATP-binding cassette domain-containing protein [Acetobacteraceae bacterium H6797]|nr:ATP-binding cassette domain-containing protein [Acetobacteraceae bacterium H6797]